MLGRHIHGGRLSRRRYSAAELGPIHVCVWILVRGDGVRLDVAGG